MPVLGRHGQPVAVLAVHAFPATPKSAFTKFDFQHVQTTAATASKALQPTAQARAASGTAKAGSQQRRRRRSSSRRRARTASDAARADSAEGKGEEEGGEEGKHKKGSRSGSRGGEVAPHGRRRGAFFRELHKSVRHRLRAVRKTGLAEIKSCVLSSVCVLCFWCDVYRVVQRLSLCPAFSYSRCFPLTW